MSTQGFALEPFHYWDQVIDLIFLPGATILEGLHLDSESSGRACCFWEATDIHRRLKSKRINKYIE